MIRSFSAEDLPDAYRHQQFPRHASMHGVEIVDAEKRAMIIILHPGLFNII